MSNIVVKFGGTSIQDAERMRQVFSLLPEQGKCLLVMSAMAGVTNQLEEFIKQVCSDNKNQAEALLTNMEARFTSETTNLLFHHNDKIFNAYKEINHRFNKLRKFLDAGINSLADKAEILSFGEYFSTYLFTEFARTKRKNIFHYQSPDFIFLNEDNEPDIDDITRRLMPVIESLPGDSLLIMEGFICSDANGMPATLGRGGSDYSAALYGAAIGAKEIQIWTDIDGLHQNDPRYVEGTKPVQKLSYNEAAELAYFGAKVLHPRTALPAKEAGIPIRILNTMQPLASGTLITSENYAHGIKAVAAKSGITRINIISGRMLLAYGFLKEVFQVFEELKVPIDMITTSEVSVSLTIDTNHRLREIEDRLKRLGQVEVVANQAIVCVAGDFLINHYGRALEVFQCLQNIPISMISYGSSNSSISFLVSEDDKIQTLNQLQNGLFSACQKTSISSLRLC